MSSDLKQIIVTNIITRDNRPLFISMDKTVKELKKEIEKLFKLNYSLSDITLQYKNSYMRTPKTINEDLENKKLLDIPIKTDAIVYFGKEQNRGGFKSDF